MKQEYKSALILGIVTLISVTLLSIVYNLTEEVSRTRKSNVNFSELMSGESYIKLNEEKINDTINFVYEVKENNKTKGYIYDVTVSGYEDEINFLIGISENKFTKLKVITASSAEWFGKINSEELQNKTLNKTYEEISLDTIGGATAIISSKAIMEGLEEVKNHYEKNY
jgi:Na+-translocating ferredoxin:NAD+ oxidoreductase RnfG subunit